MKDKNEQKTKDEYTGQYYSNQMNIVLFVDVRKALRERSLKNAVYATDNSGRSIGIGTPCLASFCKQGTVLNWIAYGIDMECRPDGSWPCMPIIRNLVFENGDTGDTSLSPVCDRLGIYGGPDKAHSLYTPSYYYWSGCVRMNLQPGIYPYNMVFELKDEVTGDTVYMNAEGMSLQIEELYEHDACRK